jgi:signal transduction histidine kinase
VEDEVRQAWTDARREYPNKEVDFSVDARLSGAFFTDGSMLRQVVWNLFRNSLDAVDEGGCIAVKLERHDGALHLVVEDDGPGIPQEKLEEVFTPFYTTKTRGTGLGLALCRQTIEALGGELRLEAAPGRGLRAAIVLPEKSCKKTA